MPRTVQRSFPAAIRLRVVLAAAALVALVACSDATGASGSASRFGLRTMDGALLPAHEQGDDIIADTITLQTNGHVARCTTTSSPAITVSTCSPDAGTYSVTGTAIDFFGLSAIVGTDQYGPASGTVAGDELRFTQSGHSLVYRK